MTVGPEEWPARPSSFGHAVFTAPMRSVRPDRSDKKLLVRGRSRCSLPSLAERGPGRQPHRATA